MAYDTFSKLIWVVDTIIRHKRITRTQISDLWKKSPYGNGEPMSRRTFYNYRDSISQLFNVTIDYDPLTFEYFISESPHNKGIVDWMLNSITTNSLISNAQDIKGRIFLEDVPSAHHFLSIIVEALRAQSVVKFDYHSYTRSRPAKGVRFEPYFIKLFKQRWYVVGRNVQEDKVKTYALDRMTDVAQLSDSFKMPQSFSPEDYFRDAFGIVVDASEPKTIKLRAEATHAKYMRALPLHHSQQEMVNDTFSIFTYRMRITNDFVNELLSYGSRITVLEPPELKLRMKQELKAALEKYDSL